MALVYKDRVKQVCSAPTTTNPFDFTGAATTTGYQTFVAALADGETCVYAAEDADGDWEVGIGTWTGASDQLARTTILASSNSGSAETFSGDTTVYITADASRVQSSYEAHSAITPGGRLTLTTGVPVTTSDVTGATTVYYTPYVHDRIALWTGAYWNVIQFVETSHALGTVTSGKNYDVFGYLNAGALALEKLIWTDDTTRGTAITLQDGRYCKSGDKTRLYLGTFRATSTSATEDSAGGTTTQVGGKRFLWNAYNRVRRPAIVIDTTDSWSYGTDTVRQANNTAGNKVEIVQGFSSDSVSVMTHGIVYAASNSGRAAKVGVGVDVTNAFSGNVQGGYCTSAFAVYAPVFGAYRGVLTAGYHYFAWLEKGADGTSVFLGDNAADGQQSGLVAEVFA